MGDFNTYWRMTINNYDATDLALVRQGYPDDIRKIVYTLEEGENGTPHVQAYIHMKRSVRLSHMKKLFPRGNFASQTSAEWRLNQHNYAQKLDDTSRSPATIQNNDPLHTIEGTLRRVIRCMIEEYEDVEDLETARRFVEKSFVIDDFTMAKVFVSSTYKTMWKTYGHEMYKCIFDALISEAAEREANMRRDTHTHTHTREKLSREEGITSDGEDEQTDTGEDSTQSGTEEDGEDYEDGGGSSDEGHSEGSGSIFSSEDD